MLIATVIVWAVLVIAAGRLKSRLWMAVLISTIPTIFFVWHALSATFRPLGDDGAKWSVAAAFMARQSKASLPCRVLLYHNPNGYSKDNAADLASIFKLSCPAVTNELATFDLAPRVTICALPNNEPSIAVAQSARSALKSVAGILASFQDEGCAHAYMACKTDQENCFLITVGNYAS